MKSLTKPATPIRVMFSIMLLSLSSACSDQDSAAQAPIVQRDGAVENVVMICADTVRADVFYALAAARPEAGKWLSRAVAYKKAYAPAPWTIPSIASVLSGLSPAEHGGGQFSDAVADLSRQVPTSVSQSVRTLPQQLSDLGVKTGAFISHPFFAQNFGLDRGMKDKQLRRGWEKLIEHSIPWISDRAAAQDPFMAYVHFMEAHDRHLVARNELQPFIDAATPRALAVAEEIGKAGACRGHNDVMCDRFKTYVAAVDDLVGALLQILDELERKELLDRTAVVFFSDHGEEFNEHLDQHRAMGGDPRNVYGFGHGHTLFEEVLRIPLVVWHPTYAPREETKPFNLTLAGQLVGTWFGIAPASKVVSLDQFGKEDAAPLYASHIAYGPQRTAVIDGEKKLIFSHPEESYTYYDLREDPQELAPFKAGNELIWAMETLLGDYLAVEGLDQGARPEITDESLKALQSIGYLQGADGDE